MKLLFQSVCLFGLLAATSAFAADAAPESAMGKAPGLSLGGAAPMLGDARTTTVWNNGGSLLAGVAPLGSGAFPLPGGKGMQMGGFLAWQSGDYRLDATVAPSLDGSVIAGLGAAYGARPGSMGTRYGLRFGAAWLGERFTVNPASGLGLAEVVAPTSDVNLTFTVNHSLTPSLSVIGTAEARRNAASPAEGIAAQNRFLFGAGLGFRF